MKHAAIVEQLLAAYDGATKLPLPSASNPGFTVEAAYAVSEALRQRRLARGERPLGYKIGFTNRSIWARYGVHAPIWAPVWDTTTRLLGETQARVSLAGLAQPRLEPEVVFGFARAPTPGMSEDDLAGCIDWVAHGCEIVQTHFDGWRFTAPDTVADFGLHGRLLVGAKVSMSRFSHAAHELAALQVQLLRDGVVVDHGLGDIVLGGPLSALRLWVDAMHAQPHAWTIVAGDIVTTGTITDAWPLVPGETWSTRLSDARLPGLELQTEA
jgi:2-oxo-3-hexenedioate decarboxylase